MNDVGVVMLTNAVAPDKLGGLERYVRELSAALVRSGVPVIVVAKAMSADQAGTVLEADGVQVVRYRVPGKRNPAFAALYPWRVAQGVRTALARSGVSSVIHGHFAVPALPLTFGRRGAFGGTGRFLYTFHAPVYRELLSERQGSYLLPRAVQRPVVAALRRAEARVVSTAGTVTVLSEFMRRELAALSGPAAEQAVLLPGGIDTGWFCPGPAVAEEWAQDADPLLFTARRLTPRTGVLDLVRAMSHVVVAQPRARLAIAGDGAQRPAVQAEIDRLGLGGRVRLLGRVSDPELRDWYRRANLTVMPTTELEGFGLTTAESLACGTPALVTPVGANPELVSALHPLLVAPDASEHGLAAGILRLLERPEALVETRARARDVVHPAWSWSAVATRFRELYACPARKAAALEVR